jgi:hypothetical protein
VRRSVRPLLTILVIAALAAPAAHAAGPTATTAAPTITTPPQQPGQAFGPIEGLAPRTQETTVQPTSSTKRPDDSGLGRSTLLLLSFVSLALIFGVAGMIWYDNRNTRTARKRRQRLRSGRTPAAAAAGAEGRRGPPPPPRKRRAQAKRKKR